jgi:hypothetical protein
VSIAAGRTAKATATLAAVEGAPQERSFARHLEGGKCFKIAPPTRESVLLQ